MSLNFEKSPLMGLILLLLVVITVAKGVWVVISYLFLPLEGVEANTRASLKPVYRPFRLVSNRQVARVPIKRARRITPITSFKLIGIYVDDDKNIAVLKKGSKSYVLTTGDKVEGYLLKKVNENSAIFEMDSQEYELRFIEKDLPSSAAVEVNKEAQANEPAKKGDIEQKGSTTLIPRSKISQYAGNLAKISKDIGMAPITSGRKLLGFKVRYVRRNSDFAKLGLKRGDIVTAINGESITDYSLPLEIMKNIDSIDSLVLTIKRGNETKELEYEVK